MAGLSIKLGIVGGGSAAASLHLPALLALRETIAITAIADLDGARARRAQAGVPHARIFADARDLIVSGGVDAVAVLTPPATHMEIALAALRAGKHTFVEKPLATTAEGAALLAQEAVRAGVCNAVGHNLRFHRLVQRAHAAIQSGLTGELLAVSTCWNTAAGSRPAWRRDRAQGGGVLMDLGVHHFDLARFLTGSEFQDLSVSATSGQAEDRAVSVAGCMRNGVLFSAVWSNTGGDHHAIRLSGTRATIEFSMYRANSWRVIPAARGGIASYLNETRESAAEFTGAVRAMAKGGDSAHSYVQEWLDFAAAIRTGSPPACPFEEGRRSVEACFRLLPALPAPKLDDALAPRRLPDLSVILAVHGSYAAARRTVRYLRDQTARARMELVLVAASDCPLDVPAGDLEGFQSSKIVAVSAGSSVACANAAGTRAASAPVVAFAEDHSFPEREWAAALLQAHACGYAAVGPELTNANPGSAVSWCDFLIGYGPWASPCSAGEVPFLPGHNSSYKRNELLVYAARLESMLESETLLHFDLARRGRKLYLEPSARTAHVNFALWSVWIPVQYHCGRLFAGFRAAKWGAAKKLFYCAASPLIPAVRAVRICRELLKPGRPRYLIVRLLPALLAGLGADGFGQMVGYIAGAGNSPQWLASYEFNRLRFVRPADRLRLDEMDARFNA